MPEVEPVSAEWVVVTVIIALAGLFATVGKPVINLNSNIVKLNCSVEALTKHQQEQDKQLAAQAEKASDAHNKIWAHEKEQDNKLNDHEARIQGLEEKR